MLFERFASRRSGCLDELDMCLVKPMAVEGLSIDDGTLRDSDTQFLVNPRICFDVGTMAHL